MGLFSFLGDIAKAIPGPIGSAFSAHDSKKAVGKANDATQLGITNAKGDLSSQLAASQTRLDPFETAGTDALSGIRDLTGLNGNAASGSAIDALKASPLYTALFNNGRDTILSSASATGGLRGGTLSGETLPAFGANTLASVIQNQLSNLGGLSSQGLGATEFGANLGAQTAGSLGQLDVGSGQANAGSILGKQGIDNTFYSGLRAAIQKAAMAGAGAGGAAGAGGFDASSFDPSVFGGTDQGPVFGGGAQGNPSGVLSLSGGSSGGGFDLGAMLKSLIGGGGISAVPGGGLTNATGNPTGYKF